jgi:nucleoside-diphosphate-sugar epimerase
MKTYRIGISCIGSGVGQSVINSCRLSRLPLHTIGLGNNPFAFGGHDCDALVATPSIYAEDYAERLLAILKAQGVELLIPGLDDEVLILARSRAEFEAAGIGLLASDPALVELCRDKERMSAELNPIVDVFVRSYTPTAARAAIDAGGLDFPLIAKPRGGFASRGIAIILDADDLARVDPTQVVQELAMPAAGDPSHAEYARQLARRVNPQVAEISIQIVTDARGDELGRMATYNRLHQGVPIEIQPYEDARVWETVDRLLPALRARGLRGPLNIQGRVTERGLRLFEMNPRFTGITGLRALMGFNEVEACVKAWLGIEPVARRIEAHPRTFGMRQTADKTVRLERNASARALGLALGQAPAGPTTVLVTGASGYLGRHLVEALARDPAYEPIVLGQSKARLEGLFGHLGIACHDHADLDTGRLALGRIDRVVHGAFARPHCSAAEIAAALAFTNALFLRAAQHQIPGLINLSSQAVYGLKQPPLWREDQAPAPETPYAQAKYATELMAANGQVLCRHLGHASLRLCALSGGAEGFVDSDLLGKLVTQALKGEPLVLRDGSQIMERLDIRDAVTAILALLRVGPLDWAPVYNVGPGARHSLLDLAQRCARAARVEATGVSEIRIESGAAGPSFGLDVERFERATGWRAQHDIDATIASVVEHLRARKPD